MMDAQEYNDRLKESIRKALTSHKGMDYLVSNRRLMGNFYHTFADSLYNYEKGVLLVERFYLKDKAKSSNVPYKTISEDGKKSVKEIKDALRDILIKSEDDADKDMLQERIHDLEEKSKSIKTDIVMLETYSYDNIPLIRFDLYSDETLDMLSDIYTAFAVNATLFMCWDSVSSFELMVSTLKCDDYIDLILIPIQEKE